MFIIYFLIMNCLFAKEILHVNVGQRVRMDCQLIGRGLWLRLDDAEVFFYSTSRIYSNPRFQIEQRTNLQIHNNTSSYEQLIYSLIIDNIQTSDRGTYSCQSNNHIIKLFHLDISERPYFITNDSSIVIRKQIGSNLSINCQANGKPRPNLSWIKRINQTNEIILKICSNSSFDCQLDLIQVNLSHRGIYECIAMNIAGTIGRSYEIDIQFPPAITIQREKFFHSFAETALLHCWIDSNPESDIRWYHRFSLNTTDEIDLSEQYLREDPQKPIWFIKTEQLNFTRWRSSLFIKHVPKRIFNSIFICRAKNRYNTSEKYMTIIEKISRTKSYQQTISYRSFSTKSYSQNSSSTTSLTGI